MKQSTEALQQAKGTSADPEMVEDRAEEEKLQELRPKDAAPFVRGTAGVAHHRFRSGEAHTLIVACQSYIVRRYMLIGGHLRSRFAQSDDVLQPSGECNVDKAGKYCPSVLLSRSL